MPGSGAMRQIVAGLEADIRKLRAEVQRLKDENQRLRIQVEGLEADRDALQIAPPSGPEIARMMSPAETRPNMSVSSGEKVGGEFSEDNPAVPCSNIEDDVAGVAGADLGPSPY